jgi:signal transduction histidine kinase
VRNAHTYIVRKLGDPKVRSVASDPRLDQFCGIIERELTACTKIIGDLLDFARERPLDLRPCPLRPLVTEAIELVHIPNVAFVNEVPADAPVPSLDKEQFRQILVNLIQNAAEAAPTPDGRVVVRGEGGADRPWVLTVSDNGPGIPADVLPKIFEPLFTTKNKGTGLGLAVVWAIVQKHQGTIKAECESGRGTNFVIEIPPSTASKAA